MKSHRKTILLLALLLAAAASLTSCVGGYVGAEVGPDYHPYPGYYGHDRWYHDGPWMDGPRGYIGIEISPIRHPRHR